MDSMDPFALFHTPVIVHHLAGMDELNRELAERLVRESRDELSFLRSNIGGWHSSPDLSQREAPCYRQLIQQIVRHVQVSFAHVAHTAGVDSDAAFRYAVHGWAMVMRDGDYTILHDHAEAHWSTVYYVDAGDADPDVYPSSGLLALVDPRRSTTAAIAGVEVFPSTFTIRPRTSSLVVFPGWLQHYVHCYRGTRPRISISCNVKMEAAHPDHSPPTPSPPPGPAR